MIYINHRLCYPSNFKMPPHLWVWATGADKPASRMNQVQKLGLLILGLQNQIPTLWAHLCNSTPLLRKWNFEGRELDMGFLFYAKKSHKNKDFPWSLTACTEQLKNESHKDKTSVWAENTLHKHVPMACLFVLQRVHSNWISIVTYIPSG